MSQQELVTLDSDAGGKRQLPDAELYTHLAFASASAASLSSLSFLRLAFSLSDSLSLLLLPLLLLLELLDGDCLRFLDASFSFTLSFLDAL